MNKKAVVEGGTILVIGAIALFIIGLISGFKILNVIENIPNPVWWIITAIVLYLIFKGKK